MCVSIVMSVDPRVAALGYCVWKEEDFRGEGPVVLPVTAGIVQTPKNLKGSYVQQVDALMKEIDCIAQGCRVAGVWCEEPQFFGNLLGRAAVTDVLHISFMCGSLSEWSRERGAEFHPAPVMQWKGNMSKHQVAQRIRNRYSKTPHGLRRLMSPNTSHDWDALGIGLWGQGRFQ